VQGKKFLRSIRLKNLLSFGDEGANLELEPLNVLIGPNNAGKSNLIAAVSLLAAAPRDLMKPIREGGGVAEWIWKGKREQRSGEVEVVLQSFPSAQALTYTLEITGEQDRFRIGRERLAEAAVPEKIFFSTDGYNAVLPRQLAGAGWVSDGAAFRPSLRQQQSVLAQVKEDLIYPQLTHVGEKLGQIRFFRECTLGRQSPARQPQRADLPDDFLLEDASNLAVIINDLQRSFELKGALIERLKLCDERVEDLTTRVEGGTMQLFLHESGQRLPVPAARLSDGMLRYLILLAVLCHPNPPPLICLEGPETGLHPDLLPTIADLLVEAAQRTQLIVTTHSDALISGFSEIPESVVVCAKEDEGTVLRRLERDKLVEWLERHELGELWSMGEIGGNRW
jgi:predicted ATPase